jgi:RimJ/RimL family protein N-acetyltransferase
MVYFRQDEPLTLKEQLKFIEEDTQPGGEYNGQIIEYHGKPVGLCGVKNTCEFTIGLLPEYQGKGVATKAMQILQSTWSPMWSEVFVGNPALEWFISKLGFKVIGVKERAYYKQELGLVDIVLIRYDAI